MYMYKCIYIYIYIYISHISHIGAHLCQGAFGSQPSREGAGSRQEKPVRSSHKLMLKMMSKCGRNEVKMGRHDVQHDVENDVKMWPT